MGKKCKGGKFRVDVRKNFLQLELAKDKMDYFGIYWVLPILPATEVFTERLNGRFLGYAVEEILFQV